MIRAAVRRHNFISSAELAAMQLPVSPLTPAHAIYSGDRPMTSAQHQKLAFLHASERSFRDAIELAQAHGLWLRRCDVKHFQLRRGHKWIIDLYPTTQLIRLTDHHSRAPDIEEFVPQTWDVYGIVALAVQRMAYWRRENAARREREAKLQRRSTRRRWQPWDYRD